MAYSSKIVHHKKNIKKLSRQTTLFSILRGLIIIICFVLLYFSITSNEYLQYLIALACSISVFLFLVKHHAHVLFKLNWEQQIAKQIQNEMDFVKNNHFPFADGDAYKPELHAFCHDLDIVGINSLFQYLNRTNTYWGEKKLATQLLSNTHDIKTILENQNHVQNLSNELDIRQSFLGLTALGQLNQQKYETILKWEEKPTQHIPNFLKYITWVFSVFVLGMCITQLFFFKIPHFLPLIQYTFLFEILILIKYYKRILNFVLESDKIYFDIQTIAEIIKIIEGKNIALPKILVHTSYKKILHLSHLFQQISSIQNPLGAIIINMFGLYHIRVALQLIQWKKENKNLLSQLVIAIGESEYLFSLANFAYNNPTAIYPKISNENQIEFQDFKHPLIHPNKSIANSITFQPQENYILTGSNMSGKSTFLRAVGTAAVLANQGLPLISTNAIWRPIPIFTSMRQEDSLAESTSLFYAELKRLKFILEQGQEKTCLILLDEILRGTNSDDKRAGTIRMIDNILQTPSISIIATHDLEVCEETKNYPNQLKNICFESKIENNELHFDYKLKSGICKNRNASFLMDSMGIK